MPTIINVN